MSAFNSFFASVTFLSADLCKQFGHISCQASDTCLTADTGVTSSIPARSHTFVDIDHERNSMVILLPSSDSRRVVVSYKPKFGHEVLVN